MLRNVNFNRYDLGFLSVLITAFVGLSAQFFWFTLDDAYITLRYSKHLAEGYGIVWNVGADPVEGYTSFLWMVIGVIPHSVGLPPVTVMKIFGVISTVLTITVIYGYGRFRSINRWVLFVGSAQISVSPAIAVLSVQGMETMTAAFLVLLSTISAIEVTRNYSTGWAIAMNSALFIGMLTRPDLVVFGIFLEAGIAGLFYWQNRMKELKDLIQFGFLLVFLPGIVYMSIRYLYFGYIFPNPFYIKSGFSLNGPIQIFEFIMLLVGPLLFVTLVTSLLYDRSREALVRMSPLCLAIVGFLSIYLYITPIQGFLYRFLIPVFPAIILILIIIFNQQKPIGEDSELRSRTTVKIIISVLLVSGLSVYPLFTAPESFSQTDQRTQGDRVVMGQALEPLKDESYEMFVTESGAIPYYSEWEAIDELGLNSEHISHDGLDQQFLSDYEPDLVQMLVSGQSGMIRAKSPETAEYLNNSTYSLVAVVHKQNADRTNVAPDTFHVYFVNTESEGYQDIACTVTSQDLEYANRSIITQQATINVQMSNITRSDCP